MSKKGRDFQVLGVGEGSLRDANNLNEARRRWFLATEVEVYPFEQSVVPEQLQFPEDFEVELKTYDLKEYGSIEEAQVWKAKLTHERQRIEKWQSDVRAYISQNGYDIGLLELLQQKQSAKKAELAYINALQRATNIWIEEHSSKRSRGPRYGPLDKRKSV